MSQPDDATLGFSGIKAQPITQQEGNEMKELLGAVFTLAGCLLGLAIPVALIIFLHRANQASAQRARTIREQEEEKLAEAWKAYQWSLEMLKQEPSNPGHRQEALLLGRTYSSLTRAGRGVTLYDEVALLNDINAASAGSGQVAPAPVVQTGEVPIEDRLAKLQVLLSSGQISSDEFETLRSEMLRSI